MEPIPIIKHIVASSIEHAWYVALGKVMSEGRVYPIDDTGGSEIKLRASEPLLIEMHSPGERPLAPFMPEGSSITPPTTEEKIHEYMEQLVTAEKKPNQHYTYGQDLWWQIEETIAYFKKYGFGTACTHMVVGRPESFLFYNREVDYDEFIIVKDRKTGEVLWTRHITNSWNKDPKEEVSSQCLRGIKAVVVDKKLRFYVVFRSQDLWGAFCENYGGFQLIKEYMAEQIGVDDGPMIGFCDDLHVYDHASAQALLRIRKESGVFEKFSG
jgi:thymidylate synthase